MSSSSVPCAALQTGIYVQRCRMDLLPTNTSCDWCFRWGMAKEEGKRVTQLGGTPCLDAMKMSTVIVLMIQAKLSTEVSQNLGDKNQCNIISTSCHCSLLVVE